MTQSVSNDRSSRKKSHLVELCDKLGVPLALFPKQVVLLLLEAVSKDKQLITELRLIRITEIILLTKA